MSHTIWLTNGQHCEAEFNFPTPQESKKCVTTLTFLPFMRIEETECVHGGWQAANVFFSLANSTNKSKELLHIVSNWRVNLHLIANQNGHFVI